MFAGPLPAPTRGLHEKPPATAAIRKRRAPVEVGSSEIMRYARGQAVFRLHSGSGKVHVEIDARGLEELAERGFITAHAKGGRLTWVQLRVPPYVADRLLFPDGGGRRKPPQVVFHSEANDTIMKNRSAMTLQQSYRHHAERCSSFRSDLPPISRRNVG